MTHGDLEELLQILAEISPMPADDDPTLSTHRLQRYSEAVERVHSLLNSNETVREQRLLDALMNSFGYGDAYELYWSTLHALEMFPLDMLRLALRHAIINAGPGARLWSAIMLGRQRNPDDLSLLIDSLSDAAHMVRYNALAAIGMIGNPSALDAVKSLVNDPVKEVQIKARETVTKLQEQAVERKKQS